jgi:hypothetical protein
MASQGSPGSGLVSDVRFGDVADRPVQKLDGIDKGDLANEKAEGLRTA